MHKVVLCPRILPAHASKLFWLKNVGARLSRSASSTADKLSDQSEASYLHVERNAETRVFTISLNRPSKLNALDDNAWNELRRVFEECDTDPACRAIVLYGGTSRHFCSGIDLQAVQTNISGATDAGDAARNAYKVLPLIKRYQDAISALERCKKPVIAAIHGACVGAGIDMVSAADIRYCSADAYFQVKEVDIGLAADVGTLQRFPKVIGNDSLARELCFTARRFYPAEAQNFGFVSRVLVDQDQLLKSAVDLATIIAAKSPVAVQGTKVNLNYSRDRTVEDGLEFMRAWNMSMLQTEDLVKSVMRGAGGKKGKAVQEKASDFSDV